MAHYKRKIEKMKVTFEAVKKNIKKVALDHAVEYFKQKSGELSALFTNETIKLLNQYTHIRDDCFNKDKVISHTTKSLAKQEQVISELRQFIEEHLTPMLRIVEREHTGIVERYKKEYGRKLPDAIQNDPFAIFQIYSSMASQNPQGGNTRIKKLYKEIDELKQRIEAQDAELLVVHSATDLLMQDGFKLE